MKQVLFFFVFSLFLGSCASNGCIGKGRGPATKLPNTSVSHVYRVVKKAPKAPTIVKNKTTNKNGRYGNVGARPPKPRKSNVG